jgi:hypothetical protein
MADGGNKIGMLGVLVGAVIVVLVGGGLLYATGALDTRPTNVTIQQPAPVAAPAPPPTEPDRVDRDRRRDDRSDRRDRDDDRRGRDGPDRR